MEWKALSYEDKDIIDRFTKNRFITCDYNFTNQLLWSKGEKTHFKVEDNILILKGIYMGKEYYYMPIPIEESSECLNRWKNIIAEMLEENNRIILVPEYWKNLLENDFELIETRDSFDYIYNSVDLGTLKGRKFSKKKNKINGFNKSYNYSYEDIDRENISDVIEFQKKWYEENKHIEVLENEHIGILTLLENYFSLDIKGGVLKVNNEVVAYTIGEKLDDEYAVIHIEKGLSSYNGSYQMINYLFAQNNLSEFRFINREDDFGNEGLREAKNSYHPAMLLKKYEVIKKLK